ncbi:uncharacterized protein LOC131948806 isoform X2 [Physella acuta]|uniref:uncharacterized protein LOC131948806 isoform X2 n=1 Tax=Physella acuta TaxID=109671 RepID=UPI0027DBC275|nr:uncharacterized protein LOC131948806 isoform X2 [Physella acuta]
MCSPLQKKALAPYIKSLEDQRNALHPTLDTINKAIDECSLWISEKDGSKKPFGEMMQQLEEITNSNFKTYSLLLGKFQIDDDDQTYSEKFTTPTVVTTDQLQNLLRKMESTDRKAELLEQKCLHLVKNLDTLSINKKSFEKSYKKKSKYHEKRTAEIEENIKALTERMEAQTELLTTHSDQMKQNTASVNEIKILISSDQKQFQEIEENVQTLLRQSNESEATVNAMSEKQLQLTSNLNNLEIKYGTLCQVLAKRCNVLDYVKDGLSKFYVSRGDTFLKLSDRISAIEERSNTSLVGFSVDVQDCEFSTVNFNNGGHFNTSTGEFTVPSDGVYCVGFTMYGVDKDREAAIIIILRQADNEPSPDNQATCFDKNDDNLITPSDNDEQSDINYHSFSIQSYTQRFLAVEPFYKGDKLFLKYNTNGECIDMPEFSSFTCYKIHDCNNERKTETETSEN